MNYGKIIELVGRDAFYDGHIFPSSFMRKVETKKYNNHFIHTYSIKSNLRNDWYRVVIKNNGEKIESFSCTCDDFVKNKTCKHVAAILIRNIEDIFRYEIIDEMAISKSILDIYATQPKTVAKQKLNINLELELEYGNTMLLKVYIGNEKKYKFSTPTKLISFLMDL